MVIEERIIPAKFRQRCYICDICNFESKTRLSQCCVCGKDLCEDHIKWGVMFSRVYCESCYNLKDKYEPDIDETKKEFEEFRKKHEQLVEARKTLTDVTVEIIKEHWINESSRSEVKKCT